MSDYVVMMICFGLFFIVVFVDHAYNNHLTTKLNIEKEKTKQMQLQNDVNLDDLK